MALSLTRLTSIAAPFVLRRFEDHPIPTTLLVMAAFAFVPGLTAAQENQ